MDKSRSRSVSEEFEYDDEDKKMDKFYDLIRSFSEARDHHQQRTRSFLQSRHLHSCYDQDQDQDQDQPAETKLNTQKGLGSDSHAISMPSFKWEDFGDVNSRHQHLVLVSDNKAATFLPDSNRVNGIVDHAHRAIAFKKRKINNDVRDDDDGEITTAHHMNNSSPPGLDLNLAL